ncbi:FitA-like ribbon-helix-helix domain-containing protein [Agrobacterium pusense]|uniref:FitA-like ribbon-helix-helix domain-containing protein n=1 Tax=Agrobacterium pusense TaxID=648995 RepID=UPI003C7EA26A
MAARAARHDRSVEEEHREILRHALYREIDPLFDELAAQLRRLIRSRQQTHSEMLLHEGRDNR